MVCLADAREDYAQPVFLIRLQGADLLCENAAIDDEHVTRHVGGGAQEGGRTSEVLRSRRPHSRPACMRRAFLHRRLRVFNREACAA
jgi:hypothetical protein